MQVNIPVTVRIPESWKDRASLSVTAILCSLRGCPVPVAYAPSPSGEYLDGGGKATASAAITAGIAQIQGGLERPFGHQELVTDVTGSRRGDWTGWFAEEDAGRCPAAMTSASWWTLMPAAMPGWR
jgi:hypothetical protein